MKQNSIFGGLAMLVAGAAMGAGAVVSGNVAADTDQPESDVGTVQVITATAGEAFSCTFEGIELPALAAGVPADITLGSLPDEVQLGDGSVVALGEASATGLVRVGDDGTVEMVEGSLPPGLELPTFAPGEFPEDGQVVVGQAVPVAMDGTLPEFVMTNPADARPGTAEECASTRAMMESVQP